MDRYITLGDGQTVIPDAYAAEAAPGVIFLYIEDPKATLRTVFDLLYENEDLTEEIKDLDRDAVRNIPALADRIGMAVYEKR